MKTLRIFPRAGGFFLLGLLLCAPLVSGPALADSFPLKPEVSRYRSSDGSHEVVVIPEDTPGYIEHLADRTAAVNLSDLAPYCLAEMTRTGPDGGIEVAWRRELVNFAAPGVALVSDAGDYSIDEQAGELVLEVLADGEKTGVENGRFGDVRIKLATGEIVSRDWD